MTWYVAKDRISISIGLDGPTVSIPDGITTLSVEDLCHHVGRTQGVSPRCKLLFGLKEVKPSGESVWLAPNRRLTFEDGSQPVKLQYVPRFRGDVHRMDLKTLNILVDHVRSYSLRSDSLFKDSESEVLGLTVLDMYREMKEKNLQFADTLNDYKKFTPEWIRKKHPFNLLKKPLGEALSKQLAGNPIPAHKAKLSYLSAAFEMYPGCFCEEYSAEVEEAGQKSQCLVRVNPFDPKFPGLAYGPKSKTERWKHVCKIEDLVYVMLRDLSEEGGKVKFRAEVARKTGWPINFEFTSGDVADAFVSALHGYYRLMEKWFFNLCAEMPSPSLARLRRDKMHGPVGLKFSIAKLREKKDWERGSYILRESGDEYEIVCLEVCVEAGKAPQSYTIWRTSDSCQLVEAKDGKVFNDIKELLKHYSEDPDVQFLCSECVPPSEYDKCEELLLCAVQKKRDSKQANGAVKQSKDNSSGHQVLADVPLCIPRSQLAFGSSEASVLRGRFTTVRKARWYHPVRKELIEVAVKSLKPEATAADMKELLNLGGELLAWDHVSLLTFYGVVLSDPFGLVLEWVPFGPFDAYLRQNPELKQVELSEAATAVVKAINELHDRDIVHGKIRCRNILVVAHTGRTLQVKLADPGLPLFERRDIPWIAPECLRDTRQVLHSKPADVWAFGTTLWEIFSFGKHPFGNVSCQPESFSVTMLRMPEGCLDVIHETINGCWNADPFARGVTQTLLRNLFQALYMAHNPPAVRRSRKSGDSAYGNASLATDSTILDKDLGELLHDSTAKLRIGGSEGSASTLRVDMPSFDLIRARLPVYEETLALTKKDVRFSGFVLGKGQYGVVVKGTLAIRGGFNEEEVAVKKLHQLVKDGTWDTASDEFKDEIALMKRLRHKNIVEVKGIIEDPLQLVLEFLPFGSLVQYEKKYKDDLCEEQLLKFSLDVAEGMEFLAKRKIVHRDLAARNVLVVSHDWVKISDFGLARTLLPDNEYYLVRNFDRKLPAAWHALESLEEHKFSTQSDVWSFGVTLCEMYSGCSTDITSSVVPVTNNLVRDLIVAIESGKRVPCPTPPNPRVSSDSIKIVYNEICLKCWLITALERPTFTWLVGKFKEYLVRWRETGRI